MVWRSIRNKPRAVHCGSFPVPLVNIFADRDGTRVRRSRVATEAEAEVEGGGDSTLRRRL